MTEPRLSTLSEIFNAAVAAAPDRLALADAPNRADFFGGEPQRFTWSELDAAVDSLASVLADAGAGPDGPVAIQLPNVHELVVTLLACFRLGARAVPFPIQHRRHELTQGVRVAKPRLFVTGARPDRPDQLDVVRTIVADSDQTLGLDQACTLVDLADLSIEVTPTGRPGGDRSPGQAAPSAEGEGNDSTNDRSKDGANDGRQGEGPDDGQGDGDKVVTICWTSGTTGTPKGVPRTSSMWLASGRFTVDQLKLSADDRMLCPFPVVNMAGIGGMMVPWLLAGATLYLHQPLDLPVYLQQVNDEGITYTVSPPPLLNMLLAQPELLDAYDVSTLRRISSGSAPLDPSMVAGWQNRGVEIINVFGSNEGAAMLSTEEMVSDPAQRARYFPRPDREEPDGGRIVTRLVDLMTEEDITIPGAVGELRFSGSTVFDGYLESDGSEFDDQGFYRTGDLFEWVPEPGGQPPRLLRFVDRAKDVIIRGGMNISAAELEGLIGDHPAIVESAAVAYPDFQFGERVGVFVVAVEGTTPTLDSVVAHLRTSGVASYKLPERLEVIDELPRNALGKVTKEPLRDRWR